MDMNMGMSMMPKRGFSLSRNHMSAAGSYNFDVRLNDDGHYYLKGVCHGQDGRLYRNDQGILLSDETIEALLELKLEELNVYVRREEGQLFASDQTTKSLSVTFADGHSEAKELSDELAFSIYSILIEEFQ